MGCMEKKNSSEAKCPVCGYVDGAEPESPLFLKPGTILENKYLIGNVLGQGGFGITYLAWDINLNLKLAIKEFFPQDLATRAAGHSEVSAYAGSMSSQYEYGLDKFLQEARTLAQFEEHPNIVSVRDFFKQNGTAYFVMSYVEGITLKDYLANSGGKLKVGQAREIMMPVMDALKEVHKVNVLHRDVSPDNIFINAKGQVILIDFGAARQAIGEKGQSLSIILKPGYAPEEQYRSKGVQGPWTDIYAVAATYYHLITGIQPPESLERMVEDELLLPSACGASLKENEEKALQKALAIRSEDRFQSIEDFQKALHGEVTVDIAEPTKSASDRFGTKQSLWQKFKQLPVSILVGFAGLLVVLIVFIGIWTGGLFSNTEGEVEEIISDAEDIINPIGNSTGNIINGGLAAHQGNMVYFRSNEGGSLYQADLQEGDSSILSTDSVWYINVSGDWIYYSNRDDNNRIYRVGTDGSGRVPITRSRALFTSLKDGWLYYLDEEENSIYKVTTEGAERTLITDDSAWSINLFDQWIYYINLDDNRSIYRIGVDGNNRSKIIDVTACCLLVTSDNLFYSDENQNYHLYNASKDGSSIELLADHSTRFISYSDGWVYFADQDNGYALSRVSINNDNADYYEVKQVSSINIINGKIIYLDQEDQSTVYSVTSDRSSRQYVEDSF